MDDLIDLSGDDFTPPISRTLMTDKPDDGDALNSAIAAAEQAFKSFKLSTDPDQRARLNTEIKVLLDKAERLKNAAPSSTSFQPVAKAITKTKCLVAPVSTRKQTNAESILVLKSSLLRDCKFPPWKAVPDASYFDLDDGEPLFTYV